MSLPTWTPAGRLMKFSGFSLNGTVAEVYTFGWRITDDRQERWTSRFSGFKFGRQNIANVRRLLTDALSDIAAWHPPANGIAVTCALSSTASAYDPNSVLALAGKPAAEAAGLTWLSGRFTKKPHKRLHKLKFLQERQDEVHGKYTCQPISDCHCLIIVDDFVTNASTFGEMARALHVVSPSIAVVGLALAKNEKREYAGQRGVIVDNSSLDAAWEIRWNST